MGTTDQTEYYSHVMELYKLLRRGPTETGADAQLSKLWGWLCSGAGTTVGNLLSKANTIHRCYSIATSSVALSWWLLVRCGSGGRASCGMGPSAAGGRGRGGASVSRDNVASTHWIVICYRAVVTIYCHTGRVEKMICTYMTNINLKMHM
jgi:hypothetical protein